MGRRWNEMGNDFRLSHRARERLWTTYMRALAQQTRPPQNVSESNAVLSIKIR